MSESAILYEGCIKEVTKAGLTVSLVDMATDEEVYAEIDLDKFPEDDREHCVPGALFTITEDAHVALRRELWTQVELDDIARRAREWWQRFQAAVSHAAPAPLSDKPHR